MHLAWVLTAWAWPELPDDTRLLSEEQHFEYQRWTLEVPATGAPPEAVEGARARLVLELTASQGGAPVCEDRGLALWVRLPEDVGLDSFDWEPLPAVVDRACESLDAAPPFPKRSEPPPRPTLLRMEEGAWRPRPMLAVVAAWLVALALALPRKASVWGPMLAAGAIRLAWSPRTVLLGGDAAYERLVVARGAFDPDWVYGPSWAALNGVPVLFGGMDAVHGVNLVASTLAAGLAAALATRLAGPREGWIAGLGLAALPLAVALGGTEVHFVWVAALQLAVGLGLARQDRSGDLFALLSGALLAGLRPAQLAFVAAGALLAGVQRRGWLAAGLGLAVVLRALTLPDVEGGLGILQEGRSWALLALDPARVPFVFAPLAALALIKERRLRRWGLFAAVGIAPYLLKTKPEADLLRFQLASLGWLVVLAALGWRHLGRWRCAVLPAWALGMVLAWRPVPRWTWMDEYDFLRALPDIPAEVAWQAAEDPHSHMRAWLERRGETWAPQPTQAAYQYVGFADALHPVEVCPGQPVVEAQATPVTDGWVSFDGPVRLALIACEPR